MLASIPAAATARLDVAAGLSRLLFLATEFGEAGEPTVETAEAEGAVDGPLSRSVHLLRPLHGLVTATVRVDDILLAKREQVR